MPNVAYIQVISGYEELGKTGSVAKATEVSEIKPKYEEVMVFPLFEDFKMEIGSDISSFSDMFPGISGLIGTLSNIGSGISGKTTQGMTNLVNMFDVPRWTKTRPIKFQLTLPFFTMTDPYIDVIVPMSKIINLTILTVNKDGSFSVPGLSAAVMKQAMKANEAGADKLKLTGKSAKLISIRIPGIIYMPLAIITDAVPTYSKQVVQSTVNNNKSGVYPLWGKLECQIQGLYPALSTDFEYLD